MSFSNHLKPGSPDELKGSLPALDSVRVYSQLHREPPKSDPFNSKREAPASLCTRCLTRCIPDLGRSCQAPQILPILDNNAPIDEPCYKSQPVIPQRDPWSQERVYLVGTHRAWLRVSLIVTHQMRSRSFDLQLERAQPRKHQRLLMINSG